MKRKRHNENEFVWMQNETPNESVGIHPATARQNPKDHVYPQHVMLSCQQKESTARVTSSMEKSNLTKQQEVSEIMPQMLTQNQPNSQYFTNYQITEMTRQVSAADNLVHQTQQTYRKYNSTKVQHTKAHHTIQTLSTPPRISN